MDRRFHEQMQWYAEKSALGKVHCYHMAFLFALRAAFFFPQVLSYHASAAEEETRELQVTVVIEFFTITLEILL